MEGLTSPDIELYSEDSRKASVALSINVTTWFMLFFVVGGCCLVFSFSHFYHCYFIHIESIL